MSPAFRSPAFRSAAFRSAAFRRLALPALLLASSGAFAQTFRGTLSGTVTDTSGAVLPQATLQLTDPATANVLTIRANGAGDFDFPELQVGKYQLSISVPGFDTKKIDAIQIDAAKVVNLKIALTVGHETTVVDVVANGVQTDTASSALVSVIDEKAVQEMPMNGRNFTNMVTFVPGVNLQRSVNGARTASINFQVDGADNVDAWLGIVASNQGGIQSVAGGLIPIEAIDQFSMQSGGEADEGRNAGANSNMVLKSGTNQFHGDVFYFDRNEFFAAISPVQPIGSRKPQIRNHQGGFTFGGPIWKDHTFFFTAGEIQIAKINVALTDTVVSDAWVSAAEGLINQYPTATVSPVSLGLYNTLFPANSKGGPATANNYFANGTSNYNSYNGVIKIDHHFTDRHALSLRYIGTTGRQTAPVSSEYADYFQTAPMHIHNFSVVENSVFSSHIVNQVTLGTNYFLQTFNDANQSFFPQQNAGLNLGLTGRIAAGAPTLLIGGTSCPAAFDCTGATQPSGRTDVTAHVTDSLNWSLGRHALKLGGEYRHANINLMYFTNSRGTFVFDGTRGPWSTTAGTATANAYCAAHGQASICSQLQYLGDFLLGQPTNANGARLLQGNAQRVFLLDTYEGWAQDDFKATSKLTVNYGLRYTVPGVVHDAQNDLYSFVPGNNAGFYTPLYHEYYGGAAPRVGFAYSPRSNSDTVIRGTYGIFYDVPPMQNMVSGTSTNGGATYTQNNPAGPDAAVNFVASNVTLQTNVDPFVGANPPQLGAFGVQPNIRMPYLENYSLGVEQQLGKNTLLTMGYVGSSGRLLMVLYDLNQPVASGTAVRGARPYTQTIFPNQSLNTGKSLAGINQLNSEASSNFNSAQVTLRQAAWHGIQGTLNYTWAHSLDDGSTSTTPMNSYNLHQDYGNSTFDSRHIFDGYVFYNVPQLGHAVPRLSAGWQLNALFTLSSGNPLNPLVNTDRSLTYQLKDRPNLTGKNPFAGGTVISSSAGRQYQYLTNANGAFVAAPLGNYGNERRDNFYGPGFGDVDFSIFKHTPITERVGSEFRVEIFNLLNQANFANPSVSNIASSTFGRISNTRNGAAAPGIGYGEPFNIQFAAKLTF